MRMIVVSDRGSRAAFLNAYAANSTNYTATAITQYVQGAYRLTPASNNTVLSATQQLLSNQTIPLYAMDNATAPVATLSTFAIASEGIDFRIVLAKTADQPRGFVPEDDTKLLVGGVVITFPRNYTAPASLAIAPGKVSFYGLFVVKNLLVNGTRKDYPIQYQADQSLTPGKTFLTVQSDAFGAGNFECASTHLENGVWYIAGMFWFK
ncbi:hypothetical protein KFL_000230470 [Klebsormidium nitens]|uniref:Uncharacterized protein n=1 Tax=Klebsormidium nitens TaxID=105231 RepID=A0A1Y1HPD9_KLENI|nr:hypothetical protein KFL_000230470 [Klebsormidium nitens]|eukprot:GAQ79069.1 hypothetical protein KFL_000230470 [Klebsormidium nitens]